MRTQQPCLNVKPIPAEVCAELKARAALAQLPLYAYVGRILRDHLAQVPRPAHTGAPVAPASV
jgi:hypothetical protein